MVMHSTRLQTQKDSKPKMREAYKLKRGSPHPLGATAVPGGINFSIFSEHATAIDLLLFAAHDDDHPVQTISLDPKTNKTFHFWHVHVENAGSGLHYAYRADGPADLGRGLRFDYEKILLDPYAQANNKTLWKRGDACQPGDNLATSIRSVAVDASSYDWEGDRPLNRPMEETVIYEMHVGGFTRSPTSEVDAPGTFSGIIEKIPYLKALGVTAVELLPVFDFDDTEERMVDGQRLTNYWGYSTLAFFAPHAGFCVSPQDGSHGREFRDMVKALHRAGIEVILDVVFNHTDEGNQNGPTISFRGLANDIYYHLSAQDQQYYNDYSGCGNTLNCNHPLSQKFILDCLRYWVREMHVDGFRFDEASVLSRGTDGAPMEQPPVLWQIELDEELADSKVIAEAWDAAGLYQVGHFPGYRWAEWNGRFRDDVRSFVKGEPGLVGAVAARIAGSADLYQWHGHQPINSVNFITAHDGFTINDLVSYNDKHNAANGEGNRDGVNENMSWNCGVEGPTEDLAVETMRERQIKNFATILMVSQGVPMFVMGDEVRRTQRGNNNAYCQDNEISWMDWSLVDRNEHMLRFWQRMIAFRRKHGVLHRSRYFTGEINERGLADIAWHGCQLGAPGWDDAGALALGLTLGATDDGSDVHIMMNMYWDALDFEIPALVGRSWKRAVDTALPAPDDISDAGAEPPVSGTSYRVSGRSIVVLIST